MAITLFLDKYRADPSRDAQRLTEFKTPENVFGAWWRCAKLTQDTRMLKF